MTSLTLAHFKSLKKVVKFHLYQYILIVTAEVKQANAGCCSKQTETKTILSGCTGSAKSGEIMAVMGSSGAGKSTFMNALTHRNVETLTIKGSINVAGAALKDDISKISAYIQQDDHFVGALSVREHLDFHADLRLSKESAQTRKETVDRILKIIGLDEIQNTIIGVPGLNKTISGGEMKRLSIAAEILTDPPIIFADEPTSGLDSHLALTVVKALKALAANGTTVLCTIHQPSSEIFNEFDSLLLLTMGRTAFCGPPANASSFFAEVGAPVPANFNPADHFIREISKFKDLETGTSDRDANATRIGQICDKYNDSKYASAMKNELIASNSGDKMKLMIKASKKFRPNPFYAFWKVLMRGMIAQVNKYDIYNLKYL